MYGIKRNKKTDGGKMKKDGNASARRETMMDGGMQKNKYSAGGTPAKKMMNGGQARTGYMKGGSAQPNYKSGEMHKCMPN